MDRENKRSVEIVCISLHQLKVKLHTPFKTAVREVTHINDLVVRVQTTDGVVGYGSAPSTPQITGEDHASIIYSIEKKIKPKLLHQKFDNIPLIIELISNFDEVGSNTKAAIDIALYDLYGKTHQQPLCDILTPHVAQSKQINSQTIDFSKGNLIQPASRTLKTDYTISVNPVDQMCDDIFKAIKRGYDCLKIKIGNQPKQDFQRLLSINEFMMTQFGRGHKYTLRLDVNQGWDAQTTVDIMQALEHKGVHFELIEQPVKALDVEGLAYIKQRINTPVMADESAFNLEQVIELKKQNAVDIINIKLVKTGGLYHALKIIKYCREQNLACMIGCMLEGSIGVAAASHLAAANADVIKFIDLDGPTLGMYDPVHKASGKLSPDATTEFRDASILLNTSPGLGILNTANFPNWE